MQKTPKQLHDEAMSSYEEYLANGNKEFLEKSFLLEKKSALLLKNRIDLEPTRSKLFASTSHIAYQLLKYKECYELANTALGGNPPSDVLSELKEIINKVKNKNGVKQI